MKFRKLQTQIQRITTSAWLLLTRSLQIVLLALLGALTMLFAFEAGGTYTLYIRSRAMQELAQTALLIAVIAPVCLEDLRR